jgi:poly(A) polymerase
LEDSGLLQAVVPELSATVNLKQEPGRAHKDVWRHTKQVVDQAARTPPIRWSALFHDVGKPQTRGISASGKVTFHGHSELGAKLFDRIARRLAFPPAFRQRVRFLVLHHLRASQYAPSWSDSAVRRFDREMGEYLDELLLLTRADITSAREEKRASARRRLDALQARILALREMDARVPPLPSGLGNQIMSRFDLEPGRQIGRLREVLEEAVGAGRLEARRDAAYYLDYLAQSAVIRREEEDG